MKRAGALVGAAAYAAALALTQPFTLAADVLTARPVAAGALGALVAVRRPAPRQAVDWRAAAPRLVLVGAVVVLERVMLASGARASHPTLSSLYDRAARYQAAKAAIAFGWLVVGWELVR